MHNYINHKILRYFDRRIGLKEVKDDLKKYGIHGYADKESEFVIANALLNDYILNVSNYNAYIEKGLSVRMLMELRLSTLFTYAGPLKTFWSDHRSLDTPEQVIELRIKYGKAYIHPKYANLGYQNYLEIHEIWGERAEMLETDFEPCYEDRKRLQFKTREEYHLDFFDAAIKSGNLDEIIRLLKSNRIQQKQDSEDRCIEVSVLADLKHKD